MQIVGFDVPRSSVALCEATVVYQCMEQQVSDLTDTMFSRIIIIIIVIIALKICLLYTSDAADE